MSQAKKLIDDYGCDQKLSKDGMKSYQKQKIFETIHPGSGSLNLDEYREAYLYCYYDGTSVVVGTGTDELLIDDFKRIRYVEDRNNAGGHLDAESLYKVNDLWRKRVDAATESHWKRALCQCPSSTTAEDNVTLDLPAITSYLDQEKKLYKRTSKERIEKLAKITDCPKPFVSVSKDQYFCFVLHEILEKLDTDANEKVSFKEFVSLFDKDFDRNEEIKRFRDFANPDFMINLDDSEKILNDLDSIPAIHKLLVAEWREFSSGKEPVKVSRIESKFDNDEQIRKNEEKKAFDRQRKRGMVPGKGLLISGERKFDKKKNIFGIERARNAILLRVIKNFTDSGEAAEPANFAVTQDYEGKEKKSVAEVEAALRFEFLGSEPTSTKQHRFEPAIGFEIKHSGSGEDETNVRRLNLLGKIACEYSNSFLVGSTFTFGPIYQWNLRPNDSQLMGLFQWEPMFKFHNFATGIWKGDRNVKIFVLPRAGFEINASETSNFARYDLIAGLSLNDNLELRYNLTQRIGANSTYADHWFSKVSIKWSLDENKIYFIESSYENGEDLPNFQKVRKYKAGLGMLY